MGRHPLQHCGGGHLGVHLVRHRHDGIGRDVQRLGMAARHVRPGHSVANGNPGDVRPDRDNVTRTLAAEYERRRNGVDALPLVDVDEVDARRRNVHLHLSGPWVLELTLLDLQHTLDHRER